jgi:peptidoglycan/LPS O-acetylase OafA/YrhL
MVSATGDVTRSTAAAAAPHRAARLADAFDPRRNALAAMRLGFAGVVALTHAWAVGFGHQPHIGQTDVSAMAVDGFFVLSGFLVAGSWLRLGSFRRYTWHRFLRIMPGFWVCLLVTAFVAAPVAAVLAGGSATSVLSGEEPAWRYVVANALLPIVQFGIGGVPDPLGGGPADFDGALWTLAYEAFCYGVLALLGVVGVLRRRWLLVGVTVVVWLLGVAEHARLLPVDVPVFTNQELSRFLLMFLLGAVAQVFAPRIVVHWALASAAALSVLAALLTLEQYQLLGGLGFAYLCMYAAVRLPLRGNPKWDLSYGLYVYHWPVYLLLALGGATVLGEWAFAALGITLALGLAVLSWLLVEGPALRLKDAAWVDRSARS